MVSDWFPTNTINHEYTVSLLSYIWIRWQSINPGQYQYITKTVLKPCSRTVESIYASSNLTVLVYRTYVYFRICWWTQSMFDTFCWSSVSCSFSKGVQTTYICTILGSPEQISSITENKHLPIRQNFFQWFHFEIGHEVGLRKTL